MLEIFKGVGETLTTTGEASERKEVIKLQPGQEEELSEIELKMLKVGFEFKIRVVTKASTQIESEQILRDIVASFKQFTTAHLNSFVHSKPKESGEQIYSKYIKRYLPSDTVDIMHGAGQRK